MLTTYCWFITNGLTLARALVGLVLPFLLYFQWNLLWFMGLDVGASIFVLAALAAISDFEGQIARLLRCESGFGKIFDPVADMLLCFGGAATILIHAGITPQTSWYWVPMLITLPYTWWVFVNRAAHRITGSNTDAKRAICCLMVAGVALLAHIAFGHQWMNVLGIGLMILGIQYECLSFVEYRNEINAREQRTFPERVST